MESGLIVIGIKKNVSEKSGAVYTTYFCKKDFTAYEKEHSSILEGKAVEIIQTNQDFPIQIGDEVIFYYGKAFGNYQPVTDFKMIKKASK